MNARQISRAKALHAPVGESIKPMTITLSSDLGITGAANEDSNGAQPSRVNPLWMITVGLALFFAFLTMVATFD